MFDDTVFKVSFFFKYIDILFDNAFYILEKEGLIVVIKSCWTSFGRSNIYIWTI